MVAVRSLAANWGVGRKVKHKLTRRETFEYHILSKMVGFVMLRASSAKNQARRVENRAVGPRTMVYILSDPS